MKKTNNYRKCPYCPHHQQKNQCCCRKSVSHPKNKQKKKNQPESAISQINTTLPISVSNFEAMPNIIAQNSILRTENDYLKKELQTQYQTNISSQVLSSNNTKDSPNSLINPFNHHNSIINNNSTSDCETSRSHYLQDKLYLSNRKLQETLMELDMLSKTNQHLNEANTKIQHEFQQLRIQNEELRNQLIKMQKKNRKMQKNLDDIPTKDQFHKILNTNKQLERQIQNLRFQIQQLKEVEMKLRYSLEINNKNQKIDQGEGLSPEWIAHTSTKINAIEKNINRLEEENNREEPSQILLKQKQNNPQEFKQIKVQLITAIKMLKMESQTFRFSNTLDQLMYVDSIPIISLVKSLCEAIVEPIVRIHINLQKQLERKMKAYESKFEKVVQRMHNMVIKIQNDRLRARTYTRRQQNY